MSVIKRAWKDHRWLSLAIGICLALTVLIALRMALFWGYWHGHKEVTIRPWMTIGYIARSYDIPKNTIFVFFLSKYGLERGNPETIEQIANRMDLPEQEIMDDIMRTVVAIDGVLK